MLIMGSAIYNTLEEIELYEPVFGDYENLFAPTFLTDDEIDENTREYYEALNECF